MAFVFYDVETTGLRKRFDQILQLAAVKTDVDLNEIDRFETKSRLMPHVVPSPKALHVTGTSLSEISHVTRQTHYAMVCEIARVFAAWAPAVFLGFNSISFDEEFLRQAFYQCLHPVYLTNTNGNARADVLNLMRAVATLHPSIIRAGSDASGLPSFRLGALAVANGLVVRTAHEASADTDVTLALCRMVKSGAPELWSSFVRFSSKAAVLDLVRDEPAFAYFDYFGSPRVMHFLTRVGSSPTDRNTHYCLDLTSDTESLRKLSDVELSERVSLEPKPLRRLKVNRSPLLYPLWDIDTHHFVDVTEDELQRTAASVRADDDFMARLTRAIAATELVYENSEHVELQLYGGEFFSDADAELCRQFHVLPWEQRQIVLKDLGDPRLRRLGRRLLYFESPHLIGDLERCSVEDDIASRRRGEGRYVSPPWNTISEALVELREIDSEVSIEFKTSFTQLR